MWFFHHAGQDYGPVTLEQLQGMLASGQLTAAHFVRRETDTQWIAAGSIATLREEPVAAPSSAAASNSAAASGTATKKPPVKKPAVPPVRKPAAAPPPPPPPKIAAPPAAPVMPVAAVRAVAVQAVPVQAAPVQGAAAVPVYGQPAYAQPAYAQPAYGQPIPQAMPVAMPHQAMPHQAVPVAMPLQGAIPAGIPAGRAVAMPTAIPAGVAVVRPATGIAPVMVAPAKVSPVSPATASSRPAADAVVPAKKGANNAIILTVLACTILGVAVVGGILVATSGGDVAEVPAEPLPEEATVVAAPMGEEATLPPASVAAANGEATTPATEPTATATVDAPATPAAPASAAAALLAQVKSFAKPQSKLGFRSSTGPGCRVEFTQAFISSSATPTRMSHSAASTPNTVGGRMIFVELSVSNTSQEPLHYTGWNNTGIVATTDGTPLTPVPRDKTPTVTRLDKMEIDAGRTVIDTLVFEAPAALPASIKIVLPQESIYSNKTGVFAWEIPQQTLFEEPVPDLLRSNDIGGMPAENGGAPMLSKEQLDKQFADSLKANDELKPTNLSDQGKEPVKPGTAPPTADPAMQKPAEAMKPGETRPDETKPGEMKPDEPKPADPAAPAMIEKPKLQIDPVKP